MALQHFCLLTLCLGMQMQQANLEMLQRGAAGAPAPRQQQQQQSQQQQQPSQQQQAQQQQQQHPLQAPSSSPADMFNNLASMYGLPTAQHGGATVTTGGPADASAPMASGVRTVHRISPCAGNVVARQCISKVGGVQLPLMLPHLCSHQAIYKMATLGTYRLHAVMMN